MSGDLRLRLLWANFGRETHARTNYVQTNVGTFFLPKSRPEGEHFEFV